MAEVTIKNFADQIRISPERLIEQLAAAGVSARSIDDTLSDDDKVRLLTYLKGGQGETEMARDPAR